MQCATALIRSWDMRVSEIRISIDWFQTSRKRYCRLRRIRDGVARRDNRQSLPTGTDRNYPKGKQTLFPRNRY